MQASNNGSFEFLTDTHEPLDYEIDSGKLILLKMNIEKVLKLLIREYNKTSVCYALIGGFAIGLQGVDRATVDIDFLLKKENYKGVKSFLESMGYKNVFESENASQFVSVSKELGEIDFIIAHRETAYVMLKRAEEKKAFENLKVKVLKVEDIIGLKIQAIANNPKRKEIDTADIVMLLDKHHEDVDWNLLNEYFCIFEMEDKFKELRKRYDVL
jgi:hypothetical protein